MEPAPQPMNHEQKKIMVATIKASDAIAGLTYEEIMFVLVTLTTYMLKDVNRSIYEMYFERFRKECDQVVTDYHLERNNL